MKIRTILVDDSLETLEVLHMLYSLHPSIEIVGSASTMAEARKKVKDISFDLISIDIQIQSDNGLDLCAEVREQLPDVFIAMCSVEADEIMQNRAKEQGANHFLPKPVTTEEIDNMVFAFTNRQSENTSKNLNDEDWMNDLLDQLW